jgi:hypothetical protein
MKESIPLDERTKLQVCAIMILHGTNQQKQEAIEYLIDKGLIYPAPHHHENVI